MSTKTIGKEGVFYFHGIRKWVFRIRNEFGVLKTSGTYNSWKQANENFKNKK